MKKFFFIVVMIIFAIIFTGCATTYHLPAVQPSHALKVGTVDTSKAHSFGSAVTFPGGESISVSPPASFTATAEAAGAVAGQPQVIFAVVITNGTKSVLSPYTELSGNSGGSAANQISDLDNPVGSVGFPPTTDLLPGQTVKFLAAFSVSDPTDITLEISPGFGNGSAIFTNK